MAPRTVCPDRASQLPAVRGAAATAISACYRRASRARLLGRSRLGPQLVAVYMQNNPLDCPKTQHVSGPTHTTVVSTLTLRLCVLKGAIPSPVLRVRLVAVVQVHADVECHLAAACSEVVVLPMMVGLWAQCGVGTVGAAVPHTTDVAVGCLCGPVGAVWAGTVGAAVPHTSDVAVGCLCGPVGAVWAGMWW